MHRRNHVKPRRQMIPRLEKKRYPARRWVVERTLALVEGISGASDSIFPVRTKLFGDVEIGLCLDFVSVVSASICDWIKH